MAPNKELTLAERIAALPPRPAPPEPPADLSPEGADCWRSLISAMPDFTERDRPTLAMAVHWHVTFLDATKAAREATNEGQRWKHQTAQAMASKQYSALLRLLGLAKKGRHIPSKLDRLRELEQ